MAPETQQDRIRAALRIVAIDGDPTAAREARRRLGGAGDPGMIAAVLAHAAEDASLHPISPADRRTLALGAIAAVAVVVDRGAEWSARLSRSLRAGQAAGLSLRQMAAAAGMSHVAVLKRLAR